jgi:hypothetical protein
MPRPINRGTNRTMERRMHESATLAALAGACTPIRDQVAMFL